MVKYYTDKTISVEKIKAFRNRLGLTQKDFSLFIGSSKATVERIESSEKDITGPLAVLINILIENDEIVEQLRAPEREYPIRLIYMHRDSVCTVIDVDDINEKIKIKNYISNIHFRAFGHNLNPTYSEYCDFLKSRCFPETRDKLKIELDRLGLPFYDPFLIIEKTEGRMAEDDFWIKIER